MPQHDEPWQRHARERWMRPDAHRWIRADAARFLKPGTDPAGVYPALARKRDAEDAAIAAQLAQERERLVALRDELISIQAELERRRLKQSKYSPSQPRVPTGNPRGGQWTDRSGGAAQGTGLALPMGDAEPGDVSGASDVGDPFQITPDDTRADGEQVADVIRVCTVTGAGRSTVDGVKTHFVIYECAGGRTFRRDGVGHNFRGVVLDPFR